MTPEQKFAKKLDDRLELVPKSIWFNIQQLSIHGTHDRHGCVNGRFVSLEIKPTKALASRKGKSTSLQRYYVKKINMAGGYSRFVYPEVLDDVMADLMLISSSPYSICPVVFQLENPDIPS